MNKIFAINNATGLKEIIKSIYGEGWNWTVIDSFEVRRLNDEQAMIIITPKEKDGKDE